MDEKKGELDYKLEEYYKNLNVEIAEFRLNLLKPPKNKRMLASSLRKLLESFTEINKVYEGIIVKRRRKKVKKTVRLKKKKTRHTKTRKSRVYKKRKNKRQLNLPKFNHSTVRKEIHFDPKKGVNVDIKID